MTAREAHRIFTLKLGKLVVISCTEYDSCFVFQAVPPKYATETQANRTFNSLYSVNKTTSFVDRFRPLDISAEEYKNGKRLPEYDKF